MSEEKVLLNWNDHSPYEDAKALVRDRSYDTIQNYLCCQSCGHPRFNEAHIEAIINTDETADLVADLGEAISNSELFWEECSRMDKEALAYLLQERLPHHGFLVTFPNDDQKVWDASLEADEIVREFLNVLFYDDGWRTLPDTFSVYGHQLYGIHNPTAEQRTLRIATGFERPHNWTIEPLDELSAALHDIQQYESEAGMADWESSGELYANGQLIGCIWPIDRALNLDEGSQQVIYVHEDRVHCKDRSLANVLLADEERALYHFPSGLYPLFDDAEQLVRYHFTGDPQGTVVTRHKTIQSSVPSTLTA